MHPRLELSWPVEADDAIRREIRDLLAAVVSAGGAVGYRRVPSRAESEAWLDSVLSATRVGDGALVLGRVGGAIVGAGAWLRRPAPVFGHTAELQKVMTHPDSRGFGFGSLLVEALIDNARRARIEVLVLGVRGNNHRAIEIYEDAGFREWGRLPNGIAVHDERYDDVRMFLELSRPSDVVLRGSAPGGSGYSPRRGTPETS